MVDRQHDHGHAAPAGANRGASAGAADRSTGAVTMEAVARLAGVSPVTVSRSLNDPKKVSPATLERVKNAIRITGYVPNQVAGALASRRSRLVAALVPAITNVHHSSLLRSFIDVIRLSGYHVITSETNFSLEEEEALVSSLLARRPDGILLVGVQHTAQCRRMLLSANVPVVESWELTETPIDFCVGFSNPRLGEAVALYAEERGYKHAAAVSAGDERALQRTGTFLKTFERRGLQPMPLISFPESGSIRRGREALSSLLSDGFAQGVIFCSSDLIAHGIIIEAHARGLRVPEDVAVIGFGDLAFAPDIVPPLTSVRIDRDLLGVKAAEALLTRIAGEELPSRSVDIGFEIITRGSA
ncbi:LacI family DNA-binding transcriptional regulator [Consotaella aegiceratis]|uniref:LacI family DNA-binding transcriptional regulator n=1 Tax=Consotaella aegiceratis TaxID=3097961 RepID=UPI002F42BBB8